jgi:hypothetical protein
MLFMQLLISWKFRMRADSFIVMMFSSVKSLGEQVRVDDEDIIIY